MRAFAGCAVLCGVLFAGCGDDPAKSVQGAGGEGADAGASPGDQAGQANLADAGESAGGGSNVPVGGDASMLAGAAGAGAAPGGDPLPPFASGTRLRAIVESAGDARSWVGWHDSELDIDCAFRPAADGEVRCLPTTFVTAFSDDECQSALVYSQEECDVPAFASANGSACGDVLEVYEVGEVVTPAKTYIRSGGGCEETTYGPITFRAATLAPPGDFVSAVSVLDGKSAELGVNYWRASDGALQPVSALDLGREQTCGPGPAGAFAGHCVPTGTAYVSSGLHFYSDEDCTALLAHHFSCVEEPPIGVTKFDYGPDACMPSTVTSYYEIGEPVASGFQGNGQQCVAATPGAPNLYEIGEALSPQSLPEVGTIDVGSGRVKARYSSAGADQPLLFKQFYDSELGFACVVQSTVADGLRCMPMASYYSLYADDGCEDLVVYVSKPQDDCAQQPPPDYALASDYPVELCAATQPLRVYKTGAKVTISDSLYQKSSQGCGISGADPNSLVFFSTTEVPVQDLAEMARVTE